jgi:hypothetical protein
MPQHPMCVGVMEYTEMVGQKHGCFNYEAQEERERLMGKEEGRG